MLWLKWIMSKTLEIVRRKQWLCSAQDNIGVVLYAMILYSVGICARVCLFLQSSTQCMHTMMKYLAKNISGKWRWKRGKKTYTGISRQQKRQRQYNDGQTETAVKRRQSTHIYAMHFCTLHTHSNTNIYNRHSWNTECWTE